MLAFFSLGRVDGCGERGTAVAEMKRVQPRQLSRDLLARNLLELTTSLPDARRRCREKLLAFRKSFAGSHSIYFPLEKTR